MACKPWELLAFSAVYIVAHCNSKSTSYSLLLIYSYIDQSKYNHMATLSYFNLFNFSSDNKLPPLLIGNNEQSFNDSDLVN